MKLYIKTLLAGATLMAASSSMLAQYTMSGYFTEGHLYRHELNPALNGGQNYVSMPALGNVNLGMHGSLNLTDVIYNVNGKTTTFMNPAVSTQEVLDNIKDQNKLAVDLKLAILSAGFNAFGGYNTVGLNVRGGVGLTLPGSIFRLAKEGIENKSYDLSGLNAQANAYAELALGHSRNITDELAVGAKLKVLLGMADLEAKIAKAQLNLNPSGYWDVEADAEVQGSMKGMAFQTEMADRDTNPRKHVSGLDMGVGITGFGLGVDLGAEYKVMDGLKVSAAVTDLGFISWSNRMLAQSYANNKFNTDKYLFSLDDDNPNNFEDEFGKLGDDFAALLDLEDKGAQGSATKGIGTTIRVGAEYEMPFYDKLTVGALFSTRLQGDYSWSDFRLSANVAPWKFASAGINLNLGTYGTSMGWIVDFHPKGFNLFLAMDRLVGSLSKQMIPLKSKADLSLGINFPF